MVMVLHELTFDVSELAIAAATTAVLRGCLWESKWKHCGLHLYAISFRLCVDRRWNIDDAVSTCAVYESQDEIVASLPIHPAFEADDTCEYEEGVDVYHKLLLSPSSNSIQILPGNFQNKTLSTDSFL